MRWLFALLCSIALSAEAETFTAKVIAVLDGDTIMVLHHGKPAKLRMANIDAPEKAQAFGRQSRESLLAMVGKRQVQVESQAVDQYGRIVGLVSVDGYNVNQEQVRRGMAWEYSHYHSDKTYIRLQSEAQQARRGLWAQTDPQAPWQWRKLHPAAKPEAHQQTAAPVVLYDMECASKAHCSQMHSCAEAQFYLARCGAKMLDGNRDGTPCEDLCGNNKE